MNENCLYLNLWKSDDATVEKKSVIVWIYGGSFDERIIFFLSCKNTQKR